MLEDEWRSSKLQHYWKRPEWCAETWRVEETYCQSNSSEKLSAKTDVQNIIIIIEEEEEEEEEEESQYLWYSISQCIVEIAVLTWMRDWNSVNPNKNKQWIKLCFFLTVVVFAFYTFSSSLVSHYSGHLWNFSVERMWNCTVIFHSFFFSSTLLNFVLKMNFQLRTQKRLPVCAGIQSRSFISDRIIVCPFVVLTSRPVEEKDMSLRRSTNGRIRRKQNVALTFKERKEFMWLSATKSLCSDLLCQSLCLCLCSLSNDTYRFCNCFLSSYLYLWSIYLSFRAPSLSVFDPFELLTAFSDGLSCIYCRVEHSHFQIFSYPWLDIKNGRKVSIRPLKE